MVGTRARPGLLGVPGAEPPMCGASHPPGAAATVCRRMPTITAIATITTIATQVHLHEAFPLQFTLPSDKPNFSFSE